MALESLGNQFQVNSVPVTVDVPTRVNIKKRRERVVYRTISNKDNINLKYLIGETSNPNNNLSISDRSVSLTQNRIPANPDIIIATTDSIILSVDKFLVTDVFTPETPTRSATPLFFAHTLKNFNTRLLDFENKTLLTLGFTDYTFRAIQTPDYVFDSSTGIVFSNIENTYDSGTTDFSVTYIKYTVRTVDGASQIIQVFHELISSEPAFTEASFDDLDPNGCVAGFGIITDGRKKYIVNQQPGGQTFQIVLPGRDLYAYKETPGSRIKVIPPTAIDIESPWNVRVTNGKFLTSLPVSLDSSLVYQYRVAEFNAQNFSPAIPYKLQTEQKAVWLYSNLIKTPKNIVDNLDVKLHLDVIVYDRAKVLKFAYTNDPIKLDTIYSDSIIQYTDGILSIDKTGGFVELLGTIKSDDEIICNYYTIEDQYEFTAIDFNPINNLDILSQRIVLYVVPESSFTTKLTSSLNYLVIDNIGEILYSSQVADNPASLHTSTIKMLAEDFNEDGTTRHTFLYDTPSTTSGLYSSTGEEAADEFSFIDKYTVESILANSISTVSGVSTLSGVALTNFENNSKFLVLADIYTGENQSSDSLTEFDVRIQGGGVKEEYKTNALKLQPETSWFWDFNSNKPYPSAAAFYTEIPESVKSEFGGRFTKKEIKDIVNRHMKLGGYAVINTYGINPVITPTPIPTDTTITVKWPSYGSDVTYNVYISNAINGSFIVNNSSAIIDSNDLEVSNSYEITGLNNLTQYFIYIGATKNTEVESIGPKVAISTTSTIGA